MADKQYWLAKNDEPTARIELHNAKPKLNPSGEMNGQTFVTYIQLAGDIVKPGHAVMVGFSTIGEPIDCRPKPVPVSETAAAVAVLNKAAEKLPQGYRVGIDFGDRAGISVFGNGEVLKHDCDSFDIAVEIANDHVWSEAKIPKVWACRNMAKNLTLIAPGDQHSILDRDLLPELQVGHRCRIAWDESGIRLIGTPERI